MTAKFPQPEEHSPTFDRGGVLDPGWNRVRNASSCEPYTLTEARRPVTEAQLVGCHRCDNGGRKFHDGAAWRCWTCHRVIEEAP
jgi:hypothetical protein